MLAPETFILLSLPNATLIAFGETHSGALNLEYITINVPDAPESTAINRDVYLLLRINSVETPIDPVGVIRRTDDPGSRTYTFHSTDAYPAERVVILPADSKESNPALAEDLETFENILAQYADPQGYGSTNILPRLLGPESSGTNSTFPDDYDDLRGHLIAINEDTGEFIGQFDDRKYKLQEDSRMHEKGNENDIVVIEIPDTRSTAEQDSTALEMFIRAVPPDQQDWITRSASMTSYALSQASNLIITTITAASDFYISHSTPSPHHPSRSNIAHGGKSPPPLPPRAVNFLTSERTRKNITEVYALSGKAVRVSSKTVSIIDNMIRQAMGANPKRQRQFLPSSSQSMLSPAHEFVPTDLPPRPSSPFGLSKPKVAPPPYPGVPASPFSFPNDHLPLPQRRSPSPLPPPLPPRTSSSVRESTPAATRLPISKSARVLLSLDLILSTIDHETRRLMDSGTRTVGAVVGHKYGPDAAHTSLLITGTVRNIGLVYVDMHGIGRRALLRRAGMQFVKARLPPK